MSHLSTVISANATPRFPDPHDRRVNGWQQRTAPPSPITLKPAASPNWRALLAELRDSEPNMLDPAVDARRDQLIALIQSQAPDEVEAECLADLMALSARIAARGRAKLAELKGTVAL